MITRYSKIRPLLLLFFIVFAIFYTNSYSQSAFHCVEFVNTDVAGIMVGDNGMIYRTVDKGVTWYNTGFNFANGLNKSTTKDNDIMVAVGDEGTIVRSEDAGATWNVINTDVTSNLYGVSITESGSGFIVGAEGTILKTNDHGLTWQVVRGPSRLFDPSLNSVSMFSKSKVSDLNIYNDFGVIVGDNSVILYTNDGGKKWRKAEIPFSEEINFKYVIMTDAQTAYATSEEGKILRSTNGGKNWAILYSTITPTALYRINIVNGRIIAVGAGGLEVVSNGDVWIETNTGTYNNLYCLHFISDNIGFAGGENQTFIRTYDGGATWSPVKLKTTPIGKYEGFNISINYPDEFNYKTIISYEIPFDAKIRIEIYDAEGKEVAVLVNSSKTAGKYVVEFDISEYASGIYYCKIYSDGSLEKTVKIVLNKEKGFL
jgi:photosystem II stability/assembly factor-like uncharacterized protein